jgi:GTP-binding protein
MKQEDKTCRIIFEIPTRGLLGYRNEFTIDTKGEGILSSRFVGFKDYAGTIDHRDQGSMISMENGKALAFSLWGLQDRGQLYITPQTEVYVGMVVGNTSKGEEMEVNPTKGKALSNVRASGSDEAIVLFPAIDIDIEMIQDDEYLEITPKNTRIRKKFLTKADRDKARKK